MSTLYQQYNMPTVPYLASKELWCLYGLAIAS